MIGLFEPVCAPWRARRRPGGFLLWHASRRTGTAWPPTSRRRWQRVPVSGRPESARSSAARRASRPTCSRSSARRPSCATTSSPPASTRSASSPAGGSDACVAQWIVDGRPDVDVTGFNIDRLHPYQAEAASTAPPAPSSRSVWCTRPTIRLGRWRRRATSSSRPCTADSPSSRAHFRDVSGWESPDWFAPAGSRTRGGAAVVGPPELVSVLAGRTRGGPDRRDRDGHVVHVEVPGRGPRCRAACSTDLGQRCRRRARADHLHAVAQRRGHARGRSHRHQARRRSLLGGRHRHRPPARGDVDAPAPRRGHGRDGDRRDRRATPRSTSRGPAPASCCRRSPPADLSNEAFPFRTAREIDIGFARVLCIRITYVGELGYELYVPAEQAVHVYDQLVPRARLSGCGTPG